MLETLQRELIYIWYYFDIQLRQIFVYWVLGSTALGTAAMLIRLLSCYVCGVVAGLLVGLRRMEESFFNFEGFSPKESRDTDPNLFLRFLKNLGRNIKATGVYFLIGILLSALFQRYVPGEQFAGLFGAHRGFGVLMAATIGVPLYACGGGTIPLLQEWLASGMSMGSASAVPRTFNGLNCFLCFIVCNTFCECEIESEANETKQKKYHSDSGRFTKIKGKKSAG